jgi:hypothetical protein
VTVRRRYVAPERGMKGRILGKLLAAALPTLLAALERHGLRIVPAHRSQILALSAATIDRLSPSESHAPGPPAVSPVAGRKRVVPKRWLEGVCLVCSDRISDPS